MTDDVGIMAYEWRKTNGGLVSTQPLWNRTFPRGGPMTLVPTVFDGAGLSDSQSVTFDPAGPPSNQPPVPVAVVTCVAGKTCTFDGTGSSDPDGTIVAYRWAKTNGSTLSTQAVFTRTFGATGPASIVLEVTDNGGLKASKTVTFTVLP